MSNVITAKAWANYRDKLKAINKKAYDLMHEYVLEHGYFVDENMVNYAYSIVSKYGEAAAELTCQMYDEMASYHMKSHKEKFILPAEPAKTPSVNYFEKTLSLVAESAPTRIPASIERAVKQTSADTLARNAIRDGAEWAWIPAGDTCAFCITLASNGWQRASKKMLRKGHAQHIHANCDCTFAVRFSDDVDVEGYDPEQYLLAYKNAAGTKPSDKINAMRRANYAKDKERINAQKRLAYNNRNSVPKPLNFNDKSGILSVQIDKFVPCLEDTKTGKLLDTEVYKISNTKALKGYDEKNGWNVDWQKVCKQHDVYALTIKGQNEIQGLIGISYNKEAKGMYLAWASAAPWNTKQHSAEQRYKGVGGHLFAIAAEKTLEIDKHGYMYGYAKNEAVMNHYIEKLHAEYLGIFHKYHIVIDTDGLLELMKEYNYEWRK